MKDDPFESARMLRMRAAFEKAVKQGSEHAISDPLRRRMEERIANVRARVQVHVERHTPSWIGRENQKLVQEHKGKLKPSLSPKWILQTETSPAALAQQAYRNVEARIEQRLNKLDQIVNRMRQKMDDHDPDGSPRNRNRMNM